MVTNKHAAVAIVICSIFNGFSPPFSLYFWTPANSHFFSAFLPHLFLKQENADSCALIILSASLESNSAELNHGECPWVGILYHRMLRCFCCIEGCHLTSVLQKMEEKATASLWRQLIR